MKSFQHLSFKLDSFVPRILAGAFRLTGKRRYLARYHARRKLLLSVEELYLIAKRIRARPGSLLVFGAGNDSLLWATLNYPHPTVFLENDLAWMEEVRRQSRSLRLYRVDYATRLEEMRIPAQSGTAPPTLELPTEIRGRSWDVILVDGPQGWGDGPGRLQSIHEAGRLLATPGCIFVHDCDREGERYLVGQYLRELRCEKLTPRLWLFEKQILKHGRS